MNMQCLLLLPHIQIQHANALSSPYTIGFPAMTAWLGAVHALQRKLQSALAEQADQKLTDLLFKRVGVICHQLDLQTYKGRGDFVYSIIGTGNPLDKEGDRPAFIEEARCHLEVTLVIETAGITKDDEEKILPLLEKFLHSQMKMAGGDITNFAPPAFIRVNQDDQLEMRKFIRKLMPGYALIERRELMVEAMERGQDALDALLDYLTIKHRSEIDEDGIVSWTSKRKTTGWLVPVATGFQGITPITAPGETLNQRDPTVPHRFAEAVVTLGEFVMPYRLNSLDELLWHYHYEELNDLYLCQQSLAITSSTSVNP